jgi:outer membrane protein assembly factor BamB
MANARNKTAIAIALFITLTLAVPLVAIRSANAYNSATQAAIDEGMYWTGMSIDASPTRLLLWSRFHDQIPTYVFLTAAPNPVGVGQAFNLVMFNPQVPPGSLLTNDIRYYYTIDIVKPNGDKETLPPAGKTSGSVAEGGVVNGMFVSDSTGSAYTAYTPDQVGNYSFTIKFHELQYLWNSTNGGSPDSMFGPGSDSYYGTTFKESTYTLTVVVQDEPVGLLSLPDISPLPTEYWTRPIEGQNTNWYHVASNWLSGPHDRDNGGGENRYQADGMAPNSAHILWTRPTEDNGVVGGNDLSRPGNVFNAGSQYQPRFTNQIIMYGRLYYSPNVLSSGSSSLLDCVDLKTGQLLYEIDTEGLYNPALSAFAVALGTSATANVPAFGYYYSQDDPNEHGIQNPGWLFASDYGIGYQPERGTPYLSIDEAPSGFEIQGSSGENLRYVLTNLGTSQNPNYYLQQWNSSKVIPMIGAGSNPTNNTIFANVPLTPQQPPQTYWNGTAYAPGVPSFSIFGVTYGPPPNSGIAPTTGPSFDWNITMPWNFTTSPTIRAANGDILFGTNSSWPTGTLAPSYGFPDETTLWAINLNASKGAIGQPLYMKTIDIDDEQHNTNILFERATADEGMVVGIRVPTCSFIGYNMYTGEKMWETDAQADFNAYGYFTWPSLISQTQTKMAYGLLYTGGYAGAVSAYNLTTGDLEWRQVYPSGGEKIQNYVQMLGLICDGKIYVGTHEHSADTPLYKGEHVHCLNATTGEEIWSMSGWAYPMTFATADGVLIYWNNYDAQIYAIGKGPTVTTVSAPDVAASFNTPVVIKGTVMDISAGTQQAEQAARFPNGVPAVSEVSMPEWMEYVYQQKARPSNTTGVEVTLSVLDSNNNCYEIGTATSDANGFFSFEWTPIIPGKFTVYATFEGSEGYWPSQAETAFTVMNPPEATPPPTAPPASNTDAYVTGFGIGIIIAIVAVGIVLVLMLRKR